MSKNIVIIQGHPDSGGKRLCHALANAYAIGAKQAGGIVTIVDVGALEFPLLRKAEDWIKGDVPQVLETAQQQILAANHLVIFYPLWLGTMPALLKAFLEQVIRPSLGGGGDSLGELRKLLKGKSARVVVTMGMPALAYSLFYRKHSLKSLQRNTLGFVGVRPIRTSLIGLVDHIKPARALRLFAKMEKLGRSTR